MSTYEISKSSLLSLKAEILKKQQEAQKTKLENVSRLNQQQAQRKLELKNNKKPRNATSNAFTIDAPNSEDEDLLRKSRAALEAKSKLYDKLSKGSENEIDKEHNRRYLVHFDQKAQNQVEDEEDDDIDRTNKDYAAENSDDEWAEFVDCFGRTRTCLRSDLASFKAKDKEIQPDVRQTSVLRELPPDKPPEITAPEPQETQNIDAEAELLSGDMRQELLRQQWAKEEEELKDKSNVHYQDVLFSEARTHGVGYYSFAKDETMRAAQQAELKQLRKETEEQQQKAQDARTNRGKQMQARIRAAKNRKRARDGLPPITSDDEAEDERQKADAAAKIAAERKAADAREQEAKEAECKRLDVQRQMHVRPWDVGKDGLLQQARIKSGTRDPYSQDEWNMIQRNKRDNEFAPPQRYSPVREMRRRTRGVNPYKEQLPAADSDDEDDYKRSRGAAVPPPPTFEYYGPGDSKKQKFHKSDNMEDSIMQGLRYLREKVELNK